MVSEEEDFLCFPHYESIGPIDPRGLASLNLRDLFGKIYVGDHWTLLCTKYIYCGPHDFRVKYCFIFFPIIRATVPHGHGQFGSQ